MEPSVTTMVMIMNIHLHLLLIQFFIIIVIIIKLIKQAEYFLIMFMMMAFLMKLTMFTNLKVADEAPLLMLTKSMINFILLLMPCLIIVL